MDLEELKVQSERFMHVVPHRQACLLPLIRLAGSESILSEDTQAALAQICDVPLSQVRELVLAFHQGAESPGAFRVCGDLICKLSRSREVFDALQASGTLAVMTACFGRCYAAPAIQKPDGRFYKALLSSDSEGKIRPVNPVKGIK